MLVGSDGTLMLRRALWDLSVGVGVDQLCAHHGLPLAVPASGTGTVTNSGGSGSGSSTAARWAGASDSSTRQTGPLAGAGLAGSTWSHDTRTGPGPGGDSESAARETGCASASVRVEPESVRAQPATGSVASGSPGTASGSESGVDADLEGLGGVCEAIRAEVVAGLENGLPMLAQ
jgi:hypothetical protein